MKKFYFLLIALLAFNGAKAQWFPLNSGTTNNLNSVYFTDASTGYAVGDSGIILRTIDGGDNWAIQAAGTGSVLTSVCFPEANTGYAVGGNGTILKTTDGGANWIFHNIDTSYTLRNAFFTDLNIGYAVGHRPEGWGVSGIILKTINGGTDWTICYECNILVYGCSFSSVYFADANTGYAVGLKGGIDYGPFIVKTVNTGLDWTNQWIVVNPSSVYFPTVDSGYVVGDNISYYGENNLLITTTGGIDWTFQTIGTAIALNSVYFTNSENGYIVGSNGIIMKTSNSGTDWTIQSAGTVLSLNSVCFVNENIGYVVGENGTILKTTNGGLPVGISEKPLIKESLKINPNPTSDQITISAPATPIKNTFMTIFNINGQVILSRQITEQQTVVDVTGLSKGVYFVRVVDDRTVMVGKFVKQ